MKLVLVKDVPHLGRKHDIVEVRAGYGRNYLLPQGFASFATAGIVAQAQMMQTKRSEHKQKMQEQAKELAQKIKGTILNLSRRVTAKGSLYGSIGASEIAEELSKAIKCPIDSDAITLGEPIKKLGEQRIKIRLADDVEAIIHLKVTKQV